MVFSDCEQAITFLICLCAFESALLLYCYCRIIEKEGYSGDKPRQILRPIDKAALVYYFGLFFVILAFLIYIQYQFVSNNLTFGLYLPVTAFFISSLVAISSWILGVYKNAGERNAQTSLDARLGTIETTLETILKKVS
jgi:hypothetical protein